MKCNLLKECKVSRLLNTDVQYTSWVEIDYCPTLVGILAGAWCNVPQLIFDRSSDIQLKDTLETEKYFIDFK